MNERSLWIFAMWLCGILAVIFVIASVAVGLE